EPLRHVLAEGAPIDMRRTARGVAHEIEQERQPGAALLGRNIDCDLASRRIAEQVAFQHLAVDDEALDAAFRNRTVARGHRRKARIIRRAVPPSATAGAARSA